MKGTAVQEFAQERAPLPHATGAGQIPFTCKVLLVVALSVAWMTSLGSRHIAHAQDEAPNRDRGILVASVHEGSPAAKAGVVRGDILMAVNGEAVDLTAELVQLLGGLDTENEVELTVLHGDELRTLRVQLESHGRGAYLGIVPCCDGPSAGAVWLGEGPRMAPNVLLPGGPQEFIIRSRLAGATVIEVMPESPAEEAGLQAGDHIVAVDEQSIDDEHSLAAVIASYAPGDEITLEVRRGGMAVQLQQELERAEATAGGAEVAEEEVAEEEVAEEEVAEEEVAEEEDAEEEVEKTAPQTPEEEAAADEAEATAGVTATVKLETETLVVTLGENPDAPGSAYLGVRYADAVNRLRFTGEPFAEGRYIFPPTDDLPYGNRPFYGHPPQRFHFFQDVPNPHHIPDTDAEVSALIVSVAPNSPAAEAGLQEGEIIVALNGEPLDDPNLLRAEIGQLSPGDEIVLTVRQPAGDDEGEADAPEENAGSQREVTVTLGEDDGGGAWLGVQIGLSIRLEQTDVME